MKKRFSADELRELRNKIPVHTVIKDLLKLPSKDSEGYFRFLCPVCNEYQTAINPSTNLARCFRCKRNFNPIDLVMQVKALGFIEAVAYLRGINGNGRRLSRILSGIGRPVEGR